MVSLGPSNQSTDMRQMYDFTDLRAKKPKTCPYDKNTLMGVIGNNPDFTIFTKIIDQAHYTGRLAEKQADFTIFVPSDYELRKRYSDEVLKNIDRGLARQILQFSMMERQIDKDLIQSSPVSLFPTVKRNNMQIMTVSGTTHMPNNTTVIHWNHPANNGIMHVTDNFLFPIQYGC